MPELAHDASTPVDGVSQALRIARQIQSGFLPSDRLFDRFLPGDQRMVSVMFWTPLFVAARVANWMTAEGIHSVVDIGSGAGKFCVVAALAGTGRFVGIEHRANLVTAAKELAQTFGVEDRVAFIQGAFGQVPTPAAEAYYLYNPFGENLFDSEYRLDANVELNEDRYEADVSLTLQMLEAAPIGTWLFTYNGIGIAKPRSAYNATPRGYEEIRVDRELPNVLKLLRKVR